MQYFRLIDDIEIPRRQHLGEILRGIRPAVDLLSGTRVDVSEPLSVEITHFGRPLAFYLTSFGVPVATSALCAVVSQIADPDVQVIPITVAGQGGHSVLNCTRTVACVDDSRSEFIKWTSGDHRPERAGEYRAIPRLVLDEERIPNDVVFFRIRGWRVVLVVSEQLKKAMLEHGCLGAKFLPISNVVGNRRWGHRSRATNLRRWAPRCVAPIPSRSR